MSEKVPTIKEIAKRLNVSVSTVSRALSDNPRIGIKTKEQVKALARELNYEPNAKAIFFKQKKSFVIGVVLPSIVEDFFSRSINGIEGVALEHGYTILFGQSHDSIEKEKAIIKAMKRQRVDGLIISLSKETTHINHLEDLEKLEIPIIYFDRVPAAVNANKVFVNLKKATAEMIKWLQKNKRKNIALLNGPKSISASKDRLDGYIQGMSGGKLKVDMQLVEETDLSEVSTVAAMQKLMNYKRKPDAVISFNDYVHMDAVRWARQHKIKVNKDVLFLSFANISVNKHTLSPPVVTIDQYPEKQGEIAMVRMIALLANKDEPHSFFSEEVPFKLVPTS